MKHPHAELMTLYAQDAMETDKPQERWEYKSKIETDKWVTCWNHPNWAPDYEYRRKPRTVNINGFEVPEPLREAPEKGVTVYSPCFDFQTRHWPFDGGDLDMQCLENGMFHLTKEAAEIHTKALISFTKQP